MRSLFDNVRAVTRPQTLVVHRREPVNKGMSYPQDSERYAVPVQIEHAPPPQPNGMFAHMGRGPGHNSPHQWRYTSLAIDEWVAVQGGWPFSVPKVPSALVVDMPRGKQTAIGTRVSIGSPRQVSLDSQTRMTGPPMANPSLLKLIG